MFIQIEALIKEIVNVKYNALELKIFATNKPFLNHSFKMCVRVCVGSNKNRFF
jgi:hypothetical protein